MYGVRQVPAGPTPERAPSVAESARPASLPEGAPETSATAPSASLSDDACSFEEPAATDAVKRNARPFVVWVREAALRPDDRYDLVIHIHGGEAARRLLTPHAFPVVLATLDKGSLSGDYKGTFPDRKSFDAAVASIDEAVTTVVGRPARADRIVLSSFSAGYRAVGEVLASLGDEAPPSGLILLDSLHASYRSETTKEIDASSLEPFLAYARRALEGRGYLALTHSAIVPPGYASTSEVATFLLQTLAVDSTPLEAKTTGLDLRRVAQEKGFVVRGYAGRDKGAHCAHLTLLPELVEGWMRAR